MIGSEELRRTVAALSETSRSAYSNPYETLAFPERVGVGEEWFTSPDLISLFGTDVYEQLDERQQKTLSFHEAVNFYSLNIHGEKSLMEGLAHRLYDPQLTEVAEYLHHFLDEENKHSVYFGTFCLRYGGKIYPDRKVAFPREYAPGEEDFLFFGRVLIFEEIVDFFNKRMMTDERLAPIARDINRLHHEDESRHLAFGRRIVRELWGEWKERWSAETVEGIRAYLDGYFAVVWREYYNRDVYRDAGLDDASALATRLLKTEDAPRELRKKASRSSIDFLVRNGILLREPAL